MNGAAAIRAAAATLWVLLGLTACDNMQHQENLRAFVPSAVGLLTIPQPGCLRRTRFHATRRRRTTRWRRGCCTGSGL